MEKLHLECKFKGLAGETKAVHCQSELVFVVQVLLLAMQVVEKSSSHGKGAPLHPPRVSRCTPLRLPEFMKLSENNFQDVSCLRKLKIGSRK